MGSFRGYRAAADARRMATLGVFSRVGVDSGPSRPPRPGRFTAGWARAAILPLASRDFDKQIKYLASNPHLVVLTEAFDYKATSTRI
jgi:hypothetical protein